VSIRLLWVVWVWALPAIGQVVGGPFLQRPAPSVSPPPFGQDFVHAAFDGVGTRAIWLDFRRDTRRADVLGRQFSATGTPGPEVTIASSPWNESEATIGCLPNGTCAVAWVENGERSRARVRLWSSLGLGAVHELDGSQGTGARSPTIAVRQADFRLGWQVLGFGLSTTLLDVTDRFSSPTTVPIGSPEILSLSIASRGTEEWAAWWSNNTYSAVSGGGRSLQVGNVRFWPDITVQLADDAFAFTYSIQDPSGTSRELYGHHVELDGGLREPVPVLLATHPGDQFPHTITTMSDDRLTVTWVNAGYHLQTLSLTSTFADAGSLDLGPVIATSVTLSPSTPPLALWTSQLAGLEYTLVPGDGGRSSFTGQPTQMAPALATHGDGGLAVWFEDEGETGSLKVAVLGPEGRPGPASRLNQIGLTSPRSASVAFDGERYVVLWADDRGQGASTRLVSTEGVPLGNERSLDTEGIWSSVAAAELGGVTYLLYSPLVSSDYDVRLRRIARDGGFLEPNPIRFALPGNQGIVAACALGAQLAVVWVEDGSSSVQSTVKLGKLELPALTSLTSEVLTLRNLSVACSASTLVLAWHDTSSVPERVKVKRFDDALRPIDPSPLVLGAGILDDRSEDQPRPAIAFDGQRFVIGWETTSDGGEPDLSLAFLEERDAGVSRPAFASATGTEEHPAFAALTPGRVLYTYSREAPGGLLLASGAIGAEVPAGASCQATGECRGGLTCLAGACASVGGGAAGGGESGGAGGGTAGASAGGSASAGGEAMAVRQQFRVSSCDAAPGLLLLGLAALVLQLTRATRRS